MKSLYDENELLLDEGKELKVDAWKALQPVFEKWHKEQGFKVREIGEVVNVTVHLLVARHIAGTKMLAGSGLEKALGEMHAEMLRKKSEGG